MRRSVAFVGLGLTVFLSALLLTHPIPAQERRDPQTLKVGLATTLFPAATKAEIEVASEPFTALLEESGVTVKAVAGTPDELVNQLKEGKIQIAVLNGIEVAWERAKVPDLKPLVIAVDREPYSRAVLLVRADSGITNPSALRGKSIALPRLAREDCRLFLQRQLVPEGTKPDKFFAKIAAPNTASDAIDDVDGKYVQSAVVNDVDFAAYAKQYPKSAAQLKVIKESEKFPAAALVYRGEGANQETLQKLRDALLAAKSTPRGRQLLELCRITAFAPPPANYEQQLTNIAKAYPPAKK